ncbi:hypothetical protein ACLB2K_036259 [Fragaria x ananassa]
MAQLSDYQPSKSHSSGSDRSESDPVFSDPFEVFTRIGLLKTQENDPRYVNIKKQLAAAMQSAGVDDASVVAIHRNLFSGSTRHATWQAHRIVEKAVAEKCGGNANVGWGWYGGSRDLICRTVLHGFFCSRSDPGPYGIGVHLFSNNHSFDCARSSDPDENGRRHILICRVILGKIELVPFGSKQFSPSSREFDSGVDSLVNPKRFIIWSSDMNSHILPLFVVSFRAPANLRGKKLRTNFVCCIVSDIPRSIQPSAAAAVRQPPPTAVRQPARRSATLNITNIMNALAEVLPAPSMVLLNKSATDFRAKRITSAQLIRRMGTLAGKELLASVVKSCKRSESNPIHQRDDTNNGS